MRIDVRIFGNLTSSRSVLVNLEKGSDLNDLLEHLDIAPSKTGIIFIDRRQALLDDVLKDGDNVTIIPPIGGG